MDHLQKLFGVLELLPILLLNHVIQPHHKPYMHPLILGSLIGGFKHILSKLKFGGLQKKSLRQLSLLLLIGKILQTCYLFSMYMKLVVVFSISSSNNLTINYFLSMPFLFFQNLIGRDWQYKRERDGGCSCIILYKKVMGKQLYGYECSTCIVSDTLIQFL